MDEIETCPQCGSDKISEITTYETTITRNVKTGKVIRKDKNVGYALHWIYQCRKCKWISDTIAG